MALQGILNKPVDGIIQSQRTKQTYTELTFPNNLGAHAIILNFSSYDYDTNNSGINEIVLNGPNMSIALPIPSNLLNSYNVQLNQYQLGILGKAAYDGVGAVDALLDGGTTEEFFDSVIDIGGDVFSSKAIRAITAKVSPEIIKGLEVAQGAVINPHVALTFDGIGLKQHSFQWQLAPESAKESQTLKRIISNIEYHILPSFSKQAGRTILDYPSVVDIFFLGTEPGYLYFFKRCMVSNFEVNYAGAGQPAFLEGGRPAVVQLTLNLSEMSIHTKEDYSIEGNELVTPTGSG